MHVRLQLLVLDPRLHPTRVDLDLDLFGTKSADDVADRGVEPLTTDPTNVKLDALGQDGVATEQNGGGLGRVGDFEVD